VGINVVGSEVGDGVQVASEPELSTQAVTVEPLELPDDEDIVVSEKYSLRI